MGSANDGRKFLLSQNCESAPDIVYVGAGIDCRNGRYAQGIQAMEDLLQRNKIPYPPA